MSVPNQSDKKLTKDFSMLTASYYCIMAVYVGYFSLILSFAGYSDVQIGIAATVNAAASLFGPVVIGHLCDKYRMNRVLYFIAMIIGPVSFFTIIHSSSFPVAVIAGVLFVFFCICIQSMPNGWVAGVNADGHNISFAFIRAFGSISFAVISVALGVMVEKLGMRCLPYLLAVFGLVVWMISRTIPLPKKTIESESEKIGVITALKRILSNPMYILMLFGCLCYGVPYAAFTTYYPVFFTQIGGSESLLGIAMFVLAVVEAPVMFIYPKISKKVDERVLFMVAIAGFGLKNICLSYAKTPAMSIVCLLLQVVGLALSIPCTQALIVRYTDPDISSTAQAFSFSIGSLGAILANMLCTQLVRSATIAMVFRITSVFGFLGAVIFAAAAAVIEKKRH